MNENKNYYHILGVDNQADSDLIKKKYRELAKKFHPDKRKGDKSAEEKFKDISEAYDVLSDDKKRKEYDQFLASPYSNRGNYRDFREYASQQNGTDFSSFEDILRSFFGGQSSRFRSSSQENRTREKQVFEETLLIPFYLALNGGDYLYKTSRGQTIKLKIPENCPRFHKMKLSGLGPNSADIVLIINYELPSDISIDKLNVYQRFTLNLREAVLGIEKKEVELYNKTRIHLNIPPSTSSHKKFKIPRMGLKDKNNLGDLYLETVIEIPKDLSPELKVAINNMET